MVVRGSKADLASARYATCVHSEACTRAFQVLVSPVDLAIVPRALGCGTCPEHDDQHCPMGWSGTARCRGLRP